MVSRSIASAAWYWLFSTDRRVASAIDMVLTLDRRRTEHPAGLMVVTAHRRSRTLVSRLPEDSLHERCLRVRIRLSIKSVRRGESPLQCGVFPGDARVGSKVIAKRQPLDPERAPDRDQV